MYEHDELQQSFDKPQKAEFKLPKIERYSYRGHSKQIKNITKLPILRSDTQIQSSQGGTQRKSIQEEDLVIQVQKRLRFIMEERNIVQIAQSQESDGDNFQRKIRENKQIIKQAKRRNQRLKKQNWQQNNKDLAKKMSHKVKLQGHQKKFRELKQVSTQNKQPKKKKELANSLIKKNGLKDIKQSQKQIPKSIIILKQINCNNIREVRSKDELVSVHKIMPNPISSNRKQFSAQTRKVKKQFSQKILDPPHKNEQLFEAIHNYLQNPKKRQAQVDISKVLKQKVELQQKLKEYELRLNKHTIQTQSKRKINSRFENDELQHQTNSKMISSTRWKKACIADSNLMDELSSFDRQMDRIGKYLHRNEKSLERYIENQKQLIDVQVSRRHGQRERYKSCQTQNSL